VTLAIHELERSAQRDRRAVERFLEGNEFPIVEGKTATFVYTGAADAVFLRHWIHGLTSSMPFQRLPGLGSFWFLVMELPERSRVEYKLEVVRGPERQLIGDPRNTQLAHDPYGANSVAHGAGYEVPDWIREDPQARRGQLERWSLTSEAFGDERVVDVYSPARMRRTRSYPLLIVHDGPDYLRFSSLETVLDNLIHRLEIPPMVVCLLQTSDRLREYSDDPRHGQFLATELVPELERRYPLVHASHSRCLVGASFGAVASLAAAWRHPGVFGRLLLQSGSFAFTDIGEHEGGPAFDPVVEFVNAFREAPGRPADEVYMSCGTYEGMIYYNRSMIPLLQSTGMKVRFTEARDGHNWENWRDRLREGLSWLFPGPLWMVYE
jgi:enterochelin esterase family protein